MISKIKSLNIVNIIIGVMIFLILVLSIYDNYKLYNNYKPREVSAANDKRMVVLSCEEENYGRIIYDKKTKVEYWQSEGNGNRGSLTLLVDADGKPLIYKGDE